MTYLEEEKTMNLTPVLTPGVPGRIMVCGGGTYCVLPEGVVLSPAAKEFFLAIAQPLLAACERQISPEGYESYGRTDLSFFGLAMEDRIRRLANSRSPLADEVLEALRGHPDPKTWFTRTPKP